jgi:hypothetical protein
MISKHQFIKCIHTIKRQNNMADELNNIFKKYNKPDFLDGYGFINDEMIYLLAETLDKSFDENCDWVRYYLFELNMEWHPGDVIDKNGNDIDFSTPEKLYDFLCKEYNK